MPTPPHHQNKLQLMPENDSGPSQLPEFRNSSGGLKQRARYSPWLQALNFLFSVLKLWLS